MTASQFWFQKGDIIELLAHPASPGEITWHQPGKLGTVVSAAPWDPPYTVGDEPPVQIQMLTIKFEACKCPRSRVHPYCMTILSQFALIQLTSPRFRSSRWEKLGKDSI